MNKQITFFTAGAEKCEQAVRPIAKEAERRGIGTRFSKDPLDSAEIGVYTSKVWPITPRSNTDLSVFLFHGLDSAYSSGPIRYNWSRFDVGLLPGQAAASRYRRYSQHPAARPSIGAYAVGWPKSDILFLSSFQQKVNEYRESLELTKDRVVLYAPTYECGNLPRLVDSVDTSTYELLIKHGNYDEGQYLEDTSLDALYSQYIDEESVTILDSEDNIMFALAIADVVVSDSDSILLEALMAETNPVTVTDWPVKSGSLRGGSDISSSVNELAEAELRDFFHTSRCDYTTPDLDEERDLHFDNIGTSAAATIDLIQALAGSEEPPVEPITPAEMASRWQKVETQVQNTLSLTLSSILVRLSDSQRKWLVESNLRHVVSKLVSSGKQRDKNHR
ncbi:hypothetical protein K0C01_02660 [Salinarchaeum sp. IM2453]|uniref:hypothetical protein n=1 Tax=Salinarchaeum sp. IM2453 TaxID=2862870 RepID=UPI001C83E773|nr:hypothetical protein [Salinarchaeum sp. IM2453]QZA89078.1 hypothetical protein K0C01_02660 [Salinarchaeum sp. IM2453]